MITIIIGLFGAVILYVTAANGSWGAFGLCAFILLFLWLCASEERKDWQAYENRRDYWLRGGPGNGDVNVHTHVNVHVPPATVVRERSVPVAQAVPSGELRCFVCADCHKAVWNTGRLGTLEGKPVMIYNCPDCGKKSMVVR